jgi:23S rRNA (uracil1939-C5)-methyltransferase
VECRHAERCGGCPVIGLGYDAQLGFKRGRVVQAFARYRGLELTYTEATLPAEPITGYRTRAKLIVGPRGEVGLYAKGGGHLVVDIPDCKVLAPTLVHVAGVLRGRLAGPAAALLEPGEAGPLLRAVDLREIVSRDGARRALVTLVARAHAPAERALLATEANELLANTPEVLGVAVNVQGEGPQVLGSETSHLAGAEGAHDHLGDSVHYATFGSFVQAHRAQAARIHGLLADALGVAKGARVLDLYAGSGAIALALARRGAHVTIVEAFAPATRSAERTAREEGLTAEVLCAESAHALRTFAERGTRFDAVVVNPPRRGLGPATREGLARLDVPTIAYVSCDPDTLARDLDHLGRLGWRTLRAQPLDMIPLTEEVETVVVLGRTPLPRPQILFENETLLAVEKSAHEPTTPESTHVSSLFDRVRALPGAASAVPLVRLDAGTSGVALFVKHQAHLATWQRALAREDARRIFVAAVRGVVPAKGTISRPLREPGEERRLEEARTRYRRLLVTSGHAIVRVIPEQARTHQVRRHFAAIGHALLGDERYGHPPTNRFFEEKHGLDRTFLHCVRVEVAGITIDCPVPGDLRAVLERFGGADAVHALERKHALGGPSSLPPQSGPVSSGPEVDVSRPSSASMRGELATDDDG